MLVTFTPTAQEDIDNLQTKDRKRVMRKLNLLECEPFAGKKLTGEYAGCRVLGAWPYRIIYKVDKAVKEVVIASVTHRQDAY